MASDPENSTNLSEQDLGQVIRSFTRKHKLIVGILVVVLFALAFRDFWHVIVRKSIIIDRVPYRPAHPTKKSA